jgi:hypothetical protein
MPNGIAITSVALVGRRLTQAVGLAAFSVCCSSSSAQREPLPAMRRNRRAPHQTPSVICARRPTFSVLPATAASSLAPRMLRRWCTSRFASGFTARHGYHISVSVRVERVAKGVALMCADREAATSAAAPNPRCSRRADSLRFSTLAAAAAPSHLGALSSRPRLSFSVSPPNNDRGN